MGQVILPFILYLAVLDQRDPKRIPFILDFVGQEPRRGSFPTDFLASFGAISLLGCISMKPLCIPIIPHLLGKIITIFSHFYLIYKKTVHCLIGYTNHHNMNSFSIIPHCTVG